MAFDPVRPSHKRFRVAGAAAAAALALAGCGGGDSTAATSAPSAAPNSSAGAAGVDAAHNDVDAMFVSGMVPHHEGAVSMSELAQTRAESPEVKDLAERIAAAQGPEIELMQDAASAWGLDLEANSGGHGGHAGHGMDMGDDSAALEPLSGAEFDRAFLASMIEHHEGALPMSRMVLADGENAQIKQLAQDIITVQEREIAEMEQLLEQL